MARIGDYIQRHRLSVADHGERERSPAFYAVLVLTVFEASDIHVGYQRIPVDRLNESHGLQFVSKRIIVS